MNCYSATYVVHILEPYITRRDSYCGGEIKSLAYEIITITECMLVPASCMTLTCDNGHHTHAGGRSGIIFMQEKVPVTSSYHLGQKQHKSAWWASVNVYVYTVSNRYNIVTRSHSFCDGVHACTQHVTRLEVSLSP